MRKSSTGSRGSRDVLGTGSRDEPVSGIKMERRLYRLADFEVKDTIGVGAFARVRIARHILDDVHQALKVVKKLECVRLKQLTHFRQEVALLQQCSGSPFIVQHFGQFQDPHKCYLVFEYVAGGDLYHHLRKSPGGFPAAQAKFHAAQVRERDHTPSLSLRSERSPPRPL